MVGADGSSYTQREDDTKTSWNEPGDYPDSASFKENTSNQATIASQQIEQERQSIDNEDRFDNELEHQKLVNINDQNFEQEDFLEKPNPLKDTLNREMITEEAPVEQSFENDKDILPFEFPIHRSDIEDYMDKVEENEIWINGTLNTITKKITHAFGRLIHQNIAEKSSRNDAATIYTAGDRENGQ